MRRIGVANGSPMRLFITVELSPPARMDMLAQARAGAALDDVAGRAVQAVAPDATLVRIIDREVGTHLGGAVIGLLVDAASTRAAVRAVTALVAHAIAGPPLVGWSISRCTTEELTSAPRPRRRRSGYAPFRRVAVVTRPASPCHLHGGQPVGVVWRVQASAACWTASNGLPKGGV
jgi:hypothetical protein